MKNIETRTLIACFLIAVLIAAAIGGIALLRHNSYDRKIRRQRERQAARRDDSIVDP